MLTVKEIEQLIAEIVDPVATYPKLISFARAVEKRARTEATNELLKQAAQICDRQAEGE